MVFVLEGDWRVFVGWLKMKGTSPDSDVRRGMASQACNSLPHYCCCNGEEGTCKKKWRHDAGQCGGRTDQKGALCRTCYLGRRHVRRRDLRYRCDMLGELVQQRTHMLVRWLR